MGEIWEIVRPHKGERKVTYKVHFYERDDLDENEEAWEAYDAAVDDALPESQSEGEEQ